MGLFSGGLIIRILRYFMDSKIPSVQESSSTKKINILILFQGSSSGGGGGGGKETRPGTEKRCSHNLQSNPPGSGFTKGRENFPQ